MESTIIEIIISEAQNEVRDFKKWDFDIIPHRVVMKNGFQTPDGKRLNVEDAFKEPNHPFRVAIVCAMWLTGFDVECLQTLYIDKPMKAHTLMQAIARAIRDVVEKKLAQMLAQNPQRMDFYKKYQEIIADYNREKDRVTIEETFARLVDFTKTLDAEQKRAAEEGLSQDEYALFQMLFKDNISKADRERLKLASRDLLNALRAHLQPMPNWTKNTQTEADVKMFILDNLYTSLPRPPFSEEDTESVAGRVYDFVWQRSAAGAMFAAVA